MLSDRELSGIQGKSSSESELNDNGIRLKRMLVDQAIGDASSRPRVRAFHSVPQYLVHSPSIITAALP